MGYKLELHKGDKIAIAAIAISIIASLLLYNYLPEKIASHWNTDGVADGFIEKELFLIGLPLLMIVTFLVMSLLPRQKELKYEMELLHREYSSFKAAVITFLAYVHLVIMFSNTDFSPLQVSTSQLLFPGISIFLYFIGSALPRLKRNHFIGIRTPWTIHNDEAWRKTHLLGGKLFKMLSIILMFATLTSSTVSTALAVIPILAVGVILILYSYKVREKIASKKQREKEKEKRKKKKK